MVADENHVFGPGAQCCQYMALEDLACLLDEKNLRRCFLQPLGILGSSSGRTSNDALVQNDLTVPLVSFVRDIGL